MPTTGNRNAVVLIRDERSRAVCSLLLRHQGYTVYEAAHAEDVLEITLDHPVDLVVSDLAGEARADLQNALAGVPGLSCMFVRLRHDLREVDHMLIRSGAAEPFAAATSRN